MRLGIKQKVRIVSVILLSITFSMIALAYVSLVNLRRLTYESANIVLEFHALNQVNNAFEKEGPTAKLWLSSGNQQELNQFSDEVSITEGALATLSKIPTLLERDKWYVHVIRVNHEGIKALVDKFGPPGSKISLKARSTATVEINRRLNEIHGLIADWSYFNEQEARHILLESAAVRYVEAGLLLGSLVILIAGTGTAYLVTRFVARPIIELHRGVEKISAGDTDYQFEIKTSDEIEDLATSFNQLFSKLRQEEETASEIQRRLLPQNELRAPGVRIYARQAYAKLVGGDWFDFYQFKDEIRLLIADASGKGVPGALLATVGMSTIRSEPKFSSTIENILRKTNKTVANRFGATDFITLLSAQLSLKSKRFVYINCGHEPPLYFNAKNARWTILPSPANLPLGISIELFDPTSQLMMLSPGDRLILYTDGLHDVRDKEGRFLRIETIVDWLDKHSELGIELITNELLQKAVDFSNGPLADDITLLGIELTDEST
ncbi:MAG: SpoIIE family protein phosphatase [Actinomycetota bacterium]|nr:SpoIIE family protein phosphatase [Actinomycetota bacterium]